MDKKIIVNINGSEYTIKGGDNEKEVISIASYVDKKIRDIISNNNRLNPNFAAILSALNITNELFNLQKEYENLRVKSIDPVRQLEELKKEFAKLNDVNEKLNQQLMDISGEYNENKASLDDLKHQYDKLYNEYIVKNDELATSYREYELMKREKDNKQKELERVKVEFSETKYKLIELQNQLLQNQIDLVKAKKELEGFKLDGVEKGIKSPV